MKTLCIFLLTACGLLYATDMFNDCNECATIQALTLLPHRARPPRPTLSGPEFVETTTHFRIHYTTSGSDSTTAALAESIGVYAETCWVRIEARGWTMPPPDQMVGGDDRYDIYIRDRGNIYNEAYGICWSDSNYIDPFIDGSSSWVEVTKDSVEQPFPRFDRLRALVAHEFHHACQFRYSTEEVHWWFYENTAVFMEDEVYDDVNTLPYRITAYDPDPIWQPNRAIDDTSGGYEYPGALWAHFLDEYYGPSIVRVMWNRFGQTPGGQTLLDMNTVLGYYDSDINKAVGQYGVWRCFCGYRDEGYHFEEGFSYDALRRFYSHSTYPVSGSSLTGDLFGPGGCYPIRFSDFGANRVKIHVDGDNGYSYKAYVVGLSLSHIYTVYPIILEGVEDSGSVIVPGWEFDTLFLIPVLTSDADSVDIEYSAELIALCATDEGFYDRTARILHISSPVRAPVEFLFVHPTSCEHAVCHVYNIAGKHITSLTVSGTPVSMIWDGRDRSGSYVPSGVYFIKLVGEGIETTKKIILLE